VARASVAPERRAQIIEATMATIAEHGISGTSLDRIAEKAGMSRGHVRHFVGNRDRLLHETAIAVFGDEHGEITSIVPAGTAGPVEALDYLFGVEFNSPGRENTVVLGLVELARTMPDIAAVLTAAYTRTRLHLADLVVAARPAADADDCTTVAYGLLTCALGSVFVGDFDPDPARRQRSRAAADLLLASL
jgi:AcrR family transcriptional regulator